MKIKEARKILGKWSLGVSDSEIENDIATAEILKNLFFNQTFKTSSHSSLNVPKYGSIWKNEQ